MRVFSDGRKIEHLARPLYHTRKKSESRPAASILRSHFDSEDTGIEVLPARNDTFRIKRPVRGRPRTTIVIPFRDRPRLLRQCLESILETTENTDYDVLGVSNCSQSSDTYGVMEEFSSRGDRIRFVEHNVPFNFSALVNRGVELAAGDYIVLMNNDITVAEGGWLDAMLEYGQLDDVGVVGAKLLYPNGTVQHAGLSVQQSEHVGHMHKNYPGESPGYMNRLICSQAVSAVTAALCLFSKDLHRMLNGFDEDRLGVAYNDVDFCLRAQALGRRNIFTPFALAYHHESLSRGYEDTDSKRSRFEKERKRFWQYHQHLKGLPDPNYNPNLDQYRDDFSY
ncbi:glycosyltransferase family 2 protein [Pseudomonadota bacterium]